MCGIFGVFGRKVSAALTSDIYKSFEKIHDRGPDRSLTVKTSESFIGFHRLAINGLDINGDQPFHLVDGERTFYLVCNGEIYNFHELINEYNLNVSPHGSDCAVILPLFKLFNFDLDLLNKSLLGEYSFSIICFYNDALEKIILSTDPLSVRPVFYACDENHESFGFSSILGGLSDLFTNINRFQQKSILEWMPGKKPVIRTYWESVSNLEKAKNDYGLSDYKKITDLFNASVRRRLISDRPIGCLLSGGLDSSLVCALAAKFLFEKDPSSKLRAFSIGMKEGTDIDFAKAVAEHVNRKCNNVIHEIIHFTPEEGLAAIDKVIKATETYDITSIRASVGQYLIGQWISKNTDVKVVLNGDGADEEQMGYLYFYNAPDTNEAQLDHYRLLDNIHLYDGLRVDRAISCHGLEARVPFLDRQVVDYFRSLPSEWKMPVKDHMEKHFIRSAFSVIYKDEPVLPESVMWRKKEAFSDGVSGKEKSWFQYVQEYIETLVSDKEFETEKSKLHPTIIPPSKEAFYYMKKFKEFFGANWQVIPYYWLPKWSGNIQEPSARVLKVYNT